MRPETVARFDAYMAKARKVLEEAQETTPHHWEDRALTAERERDEARAVLKVVEQAHHAALYREGELKRECAEACEESREQARLLGKGSEREARLITERDHYKTSLESLLKSIDDWNGSMVKEPADDFIAAIAAYITAKSEK